MTVREITKMGRWRRIDSPDTPSVFRRPLDQFRRKDSLFGSNLDNRFDSRNGEGIEEYVAELGHGVEKERDADVLVDRVSGPVVVFHIHPVWNSETCGPSMRRGGRVEGQPQP